MGHIHVLAMHQNTGKLECCENPGKVQWNIDHEMLHFWTPSHGLQLEQELHSWFEVKTKFPFTMTPAAHMVDADFGQVAISNSTRPILTVLLELLQNVMIH